MTLSRFHVPPRALGASARIVTGPPEAETLRNLPAAKKAIALLSPDQNGAYAPSVPAILSAVSPASLRTQIKLRSLGARAAKATMVPSGESTGGPGKAPMKSKTVLGGGMMLARTTRGCGCVASSSHASEIIRIVTSNPHNARSRTRDVHCWGRVVIGADWEVLIQRKWRAISAALCQRDSGSLISAPWITCSRAGGASG